MRIKNAILSSLLILNLLFFSTLPLFAEVLVKDLDETIVINKKHKYTGLGIAREALGNFSAKKGDVFSVKLMDDIKSDDCLIIPAGTVLNGNIIKVDIPKRYPSRDGAIHLAMNELELPDGKILNIDNKKIKIIIVSPFRKGYSEKILERTPVQLMYYGVSIPLTVASNLAGGVVYAIATGGAMIAGGVTGFIDPDVGRSRSLTALYRAFDGTPIGSTRMVVTKGKEANVKTGDAVILRFQNETLQKISELQGKKCTIAEK